MDRTPPLYVRRILRQEVGFGCPAPGCGNPYLTWHHFDPPWKVEQHHNPSGMIALCRQHHDQADAGAFTKEQLRAFKKRSSRSFVQGKFEWMRHELMLVLGGNFYWKQQVIMQLDDRPTIWFNRDDNGYFLLNLHMLTASHEERAFIEDNFWLALGNPIDVESPPSGKLLQIEYSSGDKLRIEFREVERNEDFDKLYPEARIQAWNANLRDEDKIAFPLTIVEVTHKIAGTNINFGPRESRIGGVIMRGNFVTHCKVALLIRTHN